MSLLVSAGKFTITVNKGKRVNIERGKMSNNTVEHWNRVGNVIFGGNNPEDPTSDTETAGLGTCVARQQDLSGLIDRDFNMQAHRWYHTLGAPQLNLMAFVFSQIPGGLDMMSHRIAEDMFHMGFLAGVASERDLLRDADLADTEDVAVCVNEFNGGVRTIEHLQEEGILPEFSDEALDQIEKMRDAFLRERGGFNHNNGNGQA